MECSVVKMEIYVPEEYIENMVLELTEIGACTVGNYKYVSSYEKTFGTWQPEEGAVPFNGEVNKLNHGSECKLEIRCGYENVEKALTIIRKIHPYEEPVINILPLLNDIWNVK